MFQNSYQNGSYFDFFDPKTNPDKLKPLYRTTNLPVNHKIFDKQLKTYVLESMQSNAKMIFPREEKKDLYLIQQYLVFQIYFYTGMQWSLQLTVSDLTKTKRRIVLSPATTKTELKPFFVKTPCQWQEGSWNNLTVDLYSYMDAFKGQTYRSLDGINLSGHLKLRRIYTTSTQPIQPEHEQLLQEVKPINFLPKQFYLPMGIPSITKVNRYDINQLSLLISQGEHSTKNSSFLKSNKTKSSTRPVRPSKQESEKESREGRRQLGVKSREKKKREVVEVKVEDVKTEKTIHQVSQEKHKIERKKKSDFLANTNGELIGRKKQEQDRPSIDKNALSQKMNRGKSNPRGKVNPWRTNKGQGLTDASNLAISKHESFRKANTPSENCAVFKKSKFQGGSQFNQTKGRHFDGHSDSDYTELSQKFSTFTGDKFFKNQVNQVEPHRADHEDEIEENIELETNSMYSSCRKEEREEKKEEFVKESINDSLTVFQKKQKEESGQMQVLGRSSLYGFGQNLMRNFMAQNIERPYSPPMGERESTRDEGQSRKLVVQKDEVELMFDPVLNCYYDYRTHTYYQLKN